MSQLTSELFDITEFAHHAPEDIFISTVTIIGALIIMLTIQWKLALVIAVTIPIFLIVVWKCRFSMQNASRNVKKEMAAINTDFESGLSGLRTAKAFANEEKELDKFDSANLSYRDSKADFYRAMGRFNAVMEFFMCILSAIVIAVGGALIMSDQLNIIDLITFSLYVSTFVNPVRKLSTTVELIANGTASLHRYVQLMRTEATLKDAPDAVELQKIEGKIDIEHVGFSYEGGHEVLQNVSLHIVPGETIAFVGSSGGGKTTLSQLIPRFYDVTEGRISVDGVDVRRQHRNLCIKILVWCSRTSFFLQTVLQKIFVMGNWTQQWMRSSGQQRWQKSMMTSWKCQKVLIRMLERGEFFFLEDKSREFLSHVFS